MCTENLKFVDRDEVEQVCEGLRYVDEEGRAWRIAIELQPSGEGEETRYWVFGPDWVYGPECDGPLTDGHGANRARALANARRLIQRRVQWKKECPRCLYW
jgi:hypothetical protein